MPRRAWNYVQIKENRNLYGGVYLVIGAGKPCAAHASARDSPSTPRYLLRPSPVVFGAVRPDGSEINRLPKMRTSSLCNVSNPIYFLIPFRKWCVKKNASWRIRAINKLDNTYPIVLTWLDSIESSHAVYLPHYDIKLWADRTF